mmetsp:Transcript_13232/g.20168  ORF Transcript_13232/g.20168 Transcript_13232/m.20168 type:complete len:493 (+) Transcript_13232:135-1613(+)
MNLICIISLFYLAIFYFPLVEAIKLAFIEGTVVDTSLLPELPDLPYIPDEKEKGKFIYVEQWGTGNGLKAESPLSTIHDALELATEGDVILVGVGKYYESGSGYCVALTMDVPNVKLVANPLNPPKSQVIVIPDSGAQNRGLKILADNIVVDGLTFAGFSSGTIIVGDGPGTTVRNTILKQLNIYAEGDAIVSSYVDPIPNRPPVIDGMLVLNCNIVGKGETFIGFNCGQGPCNNVRIEKMTVTGPFEPGQNVGSGYDGIAFESADNVAIVECTIRTVGADGIDVKGTRVVVVGSKVDTVGRNGIKIWNGGDIVSSIVTSTGADAAIVLGSGTYRFVHNTVARTGRDGVSYVMTVGYDENDPSGVLHLYNSIFYENAGPIFVSSSYDLMVDGLIVGETLNNQYFVYGDRNWGPSDVECLDDLNDMKEYFDTESIFFENPYFLPYNFGLQELSVGRNNGVVHVEGLERIYSFNNLPRGRPRLGAPDIGAYERG